MMRRMIINAQNDELGLYRSFINNLLQKFSRVYCRGAMRYSMEKLELLLSIIFLIVRPHRTENRPVRASL